MIDDWLIAIFGLFGFFTAILFYILKTWREIARVEGRVESLREDIRRMRGDNEGIRERLRNLEIKEKTE